MKLQLSLLFAFAGFVGLMASERIVSIPHFQIISKAEAIVGRPLTPVSAAGVARRTARRY